MVSLVTLFISLPYKQHNYYAWVFHSASDSSVLMGSAVEKKTFPTAGLVSSSFRKKAKTDAEQLLLLKIRSDLPAQNLMSSYLGEHLFLF